MRVKGDFNLIWMEVFNQQLDDLIKHLDCRQDFYQSGGGSKIAPKIGRYRVGQGRQVGQKSGTSLMDVPLWYLN